MSPAVLLALAIALEVFGTSMLRVSEGMSKAAPSIAALTAYALSFYLLAKVLEHLDIGLTYAIWAGIGTATVAVIGVVLWNEPMGALKVLSIVAVIGGVIGLNLSGAH
jgi:small multidrug resistance pump